VALVHVVGLVVVLAVGSGSNSTSSSSIGPIQFLWSSSS